MIIDKLRTATRAEHEALEQDMFPLIQGITDAKTYGQLLQLFYGYYQPLEKDIEPYGAALLDDYAQRRKVQWIRNDLLAMDLPQDGIRIDKYNPVVDSRAAAMGALYVMEGSTLGGKIICKTIRENLGLPDHNGLSFFNGYGAETGSKWKTFLQVLDGFSETPEEETIVQSARAVFAGFSRWISDNRQE